MSKTLLSIDSAVVSDIPYTGMELKINGNGLPTSGINAWFVCSSTTPLTVLSSTASALYVKIPSYSGDTVCRLSQHLNYLILIIELMLHVLVQYQVLDFLILSLRLT
jgi:hypothetical protein